MPFPYADLLIEHERLEIGGLRRNATICRPTTVKHWNSIEPSTTADELAFPQSWTQ
jgi:hypothetical protein